MNNFFSSNIKYLRISKSLSQLDVAQKLNKDSSTIGRWERGEREPSIEDLIQIADLFNITPQALLFEDLRFKNNVLEDKIINNVRMLSPEEQEKVLAMIDLIRK